VRRADPWLREILLGVYACVIVCELETSTVRRLRAEFDVI